MNKNPNSNPMIGQFELIVKDLMDNNIKYVNDADTTGLNYPGLANPVPTDTSGQCEYTEYQNAKLEELRNSIDMISNKIVVGDYNTQLMKNYVKWIDQVRTTVIANINSNTLYISKRGY